MHPFEYEAPATLHDALALLAEHRDEAKVLAGGQSLVPLLNYRLAKPRVVVDINDLPFAAIRVDDGHVSLGALVRHHHLEESADVASHCPVLKEAAALIGNVRVRALGTVGGSLAHADPAAELPLVMVALDARLDVRSARGQRTLAAREFFTGYLSTALAPDEVIVDVRVPVIGDAGHALEEFARRAGDFALVAALAVVSLDARGRVATARLGVGGVGPTPVRLPAAEDALVGHEPSDERLTRVAAVVADALDPQADAFASAAYRRHLARVLIRRALTRAVARALEVA
ncbi:MAG TPA: xanthine dehydrogenase family protein subunit M [Methylomirabilota bacterium]|jgi:CO/xanthine dehydrogenase FAD-binding subunit